MLGPILQDKEETWDENHHSQIADLLDMTLHCNYSPNHEFLAKPRPPTRPPPEGPEHYPLYGDREPTPQIRLCCPKCPSVRETRLRPDGIETNVGRILSSASRLARNNAPWFADGSSTYICKHVYRLTASCGQPNATSDNLVVDSMTHSVLVSLAGTVIYGERQCRAACPRVAVPSPRQPTPIHANPRQIHASLRQHS